MRFITLSLKTGFCLLKEATFASSCDIFYLSCRLNFNVFRFKLLTTAVQFAVARWKTFVFLTSEESP